MEILEILFGYIEMLKDPSVPENRVARKTAFITLIMIAALFYYRHFALGFGFGAPLFITVATSFFIFIFLGMLGGTAAGAFYESFLGSVGATRQGPSVPVFFAECLFAICGPFLGFLLFAIVMTRGASF